MGFSIERSVFGNLVVIGIRFRLRELSGWFIDWGVVKWGQGGGFGWLGWVKLPGGQQALLKVIIDWQVLSVELF